MEPNPSRTSVTSSSCTCSTLTARLKDRLLQNRLNQGLRFPVVRFAWKLVPAELQHGLRFRQLGNSGRDVPLRLLDELRPYADGLDPAVRAALFRSLAAALRNGRVFNLTWRLQEKTDLAALPEIAEGWGDRDMSFPPVGPDGAPVFHAPPKSWDAAATDGERWVWALARLGETAPAEEARERIEEYGR